MIVRRRPDIDRFLKSPGPDFRAALVFGRDVGVIRERASELASRLTERPDDPFDTAFLTEGDLEAAPERLEEELAALSLIGGRRLVRLRIADSARSEKTAHEALALHLEGKLNPDAFLLVEAGDLGRDSGLRKLAEKAEGCAAIACYEDEAGDLVRFTREALAAESLSLTAEAQQLFVQRLPHDRGVARREIERLILYLGPGSGVAAGPKDLDDFLGVEPEASLTEAASEAFGGRLAAAQASLGRASREGLGGAAAVRAMSGHLARLRRVAVSHQQGSSIQEAIKGAGIFWKAEREMARQARVWNLAELDAIQPDLLAADQACKQTGSPDGLIAERLALSLASRARRLGL